MKTPTPKKKTGRPRTLTPELEPVLFQGIAEGKTIRDACKAAGVSFQTVAVRRAADDGFRDRLARAYLHGSVFSLDDAEHRLRTSTNKRISVDREVAHHARWRAARLLPQFKDKLGIDAAIEDKRDPNDPRWSWEGKPAAEWSSAERIEAARHVSFGLAARAHQLREWGFAELADGLNFVALAACKQLQGLPPKPAEPRLLSGPSGPAPGKPAQPEAEFIPGDGAADAGAQREADALEGERLAEREIAREIRRREAHPRVVGSSRRPLSWNR